MCMYIYIYIYLYINPAGAAQRIRSVRGWRNMVGHLIESLGNKSNYHGPRCTAACVKIRGVRFHRSRDFERYYFNCTYHYHYHYYYYYYVHYCYCYFYYYVLLVVVIVITLTIITLLSL